MKNRILAAMALCCATSSTMPLWAAEYGDPTIVTVEPNLATDGTGGGKYYIYHVATRKFIAAGNASGHATERGFHRAGNNHGLRGRTSSVIGTGTEGAGQRLDF